MLPTAWLTTFSSSSGAVSAEDVGYVSVSDGQLFAGRPSSVRHTESMAETASRLLFCLVSWVSRIPSFSALADSDQVDR